MKDYTEEAAEKALLEIIERRTGYSNTEDLQEMIMRTVASAHEDLDKS